MANTLVDLGKEVAVLKNQMAQLVGNGQPGVIARLDKRLETLESFRWILLGAIILAAFLSGTGLVSLEHILKLFGG